MSVKYDFSGKLILVTGSTAGIGYEIANQYAKAGGNVIVNGRKKETVDKLVADFTKSIEESKDNSNQKIYGIVADVSTADGCAKLIAEVQQIGHLDILVNNVGIFQSKSFFDVTDEEWLNTFTVNVMSTVRLCRAFLKQMLEIDAKTKQTKGGNIVSISSECGYRGFETMVDYAMTKAAQMNIMRSLSELTKGTPNVRVNSLCPGPTWTPGVEKFMESFAKTKGIESVEQAIKQYFKESEPNSLKQGFLSTLEVANACLYLTSDASSGTNGSALRVEGGLVKIAY